MKLYITGVSGFVGRTLARRAHDQGHRVSGSGSCEGSRVRAPGRLDRFDVLPLGNDVPTTTFDGVDAVIHAAYDPSPAAEARNLSGTLACRDAAARAGVARQLFVSSCSAAHDAPSAYGRHKHRLEEAFLDAGHPIIRPGLVLGYGGLFRKMVDLVARLPIVPLIDGGRAETPVIGPGELARAVLSLLADTALPRDTALPGDTTLPREANLYHRRPVALFELIRGLGRALERRALFVPVPSALLLPPLRLARRLGIPLPIGEDNVHGYRALAPHARASHLGSLVDGETPVGTLLAEAVTERRRLRRGALA